MGRFNVVGEPLCTEKLMLKNFSYKVFDDQEPVEFKQVALNRQMSIFAYDCSYLGISEFY